jgi:phosphoribosylanthranilate isomerase
MSPIQLKICGLRDNYEAVSALRPDFVGLIFYRKSPRYVGKDFAIPPTGQKGRRVGVFVNERIEEIMQLARLYELDYVQLHGDESPEVCAQTMQKGIKVIKAFQLHEDFDFHSLKQYRETADYFLFDTKCASYGGSGKSFNWDILQRYDMEKKYFLSGGLGMENLKRLHQLDLRKVQAVDVNSRFEISPGVKDVYALQSFMRKLKTLNKEIAEAQQ